MAEKNNREDLEQVKLQEDAPEEFEAEELDDEALEDVSGGSGSGCDCGCRPN